MSSKKRKSSEERKSEIRAEQVVRRRQPEGPCVGRDEPDGARLNEDCAVVANAEGVLQLELGDGDLAKATDARLELAPLVTGWLRDHGRGSVSEVALALEIQRTLAFRVLDLLRDNGYVRLCMGQDGKTEALHKLLELTSPDDPRDDRPMERDRDAETRWQAEAAAEAEREDGLEVLGPSFRKAYDQLVDAAGAGRREAVRAARAAAWDVIARVGDAWENLQDCGPPESASVGGLPMASVEENLRVVESSEMGPMPSHEDLQAWLDGMCAAVKRVTGGRGHFGSGPMNKAFADRIRALLEQLGYRVLDPKTGCPGKLYHRQSGRARGGQFFIQVIDEHGCRASGFASASLPELRLVDIEDGLTD